MAARVDESRELGARKLARRVRDVVVCSLDRPRHEKRVNDVRQTGAAIRLIGDGDVAGAIAPSMPESGVDVYMGIGGSPEAVLAAAAVKCLGGDILARMWPKNEEERKSLIEDGHDANFKKTYSIDDMAQGEGIIFAGTGVTDNAMLRGVSVHGHTAMTESVIMRARTRTVRYSKTYHDLTRKTIHLASEPGAARL